MNALRDRSTFCFHHHPGHIQNQKRKDQLGKERSTLEGKRIRSGDENVQKTHRARVDGVDEATEHLAVPIVPATRSFIRGRTRATAHDILISMLWIEIDNKWEFQKSRKYEQLSEKKTLTIISCNMTPHMTALALRVSNNIFQALR